MDQTNEIWPQTYKFGDNEHFCRIGPIKYHEANMEKKGVEGENGAVDPHLFLFYAYHDSHQRIK